jgi:tetratricopeptide (TPR) repeat protein
LSCNWLGGIQLNSEIHFAEETFNMTAKFFRIPVALLALVLALSVGASFAGAGTAQDNKDKGEKKEKVNKAEEAAYKNVLAAQSADPATQIQAGTDFITKFPMSKYAGGVYGMLTSAYFGTGKTDEMFATGAKALELDPNNVDVLSLLAMAIPRRVKPNTPDGPQQLAKAETYAHHAIDLIPTMEKPATVDDATFEKAKNDKLALCHSGLGLLDIGRQKYSDARTELTQAVQLASTPDPVDYYLLGNADAQDGFLHGAMAAYEKCAASGPLTTQCKSRQDSVKKDIDSGTKLSRD